MSSTGDKKRTPKRLFSFDNIKTPGSRRSSSEGGDGEPSKHARGLSRKANLTEVRERDDDEDTATIRTMSPIQDPFASRPGTPTARPSSRASSRPKTPDGGRPTSARRWDTLRHHVLPTPTSRPSSPATHASRPSTSSLGSPRPSTPKLSRFPRLAFRQVVDHAKEANDARKFAEEVLRTCQAIRYPMDGPKGKPDKDNQSTIGGSSMYLPFMSTPTVNSGSSTMNATGVSKKSDSKRPPSQSAQSLVNPSKAVTSLRALHQILFHYSAPPSDSIAIPAYLPHESHVLSALLAPFQAPSASGKWEEERAFAVESFELLIKGWLPKDEAASVDRCLWCCKAALTPPSPNRGRILVSLKRLLIPGDRNRFLISPGAFQSISHSLCILQAFLHSPAAAANQGETGVLREVTEQFLSGSYGEINETQVEEEYGVVWLPEDSKTGLKKVMFLEALTRCIEHGSLSARVWLLLNFLEENWLSPQGRVGRTPMQNAIRSRTLNTFCRAAHTLLRAANLEGGQRYAVSQQITALLQTRVIPEAALLDQMLALDVRGAVVKVAVECLFLHDLKEAIRWAVTNICQWLQNEDPLWRSSLDKHLQKLISDRPWDTMPTLFSSITQHIPDPHRKTVISVALPLLNDRMVNDPPQEKNPDLQNILSALSRLYPPVFFKSLFQCAVSTKEFTVINHLCTLAIHSHYIDDFWLRDTEMVAMALLSDTGAPKESTSWSSANVPWTAARLGQSVLMVELIARLQAVRRLKESSSISDATFVSVTKYVLTLESRLSILIEAKEKKALIAPSQRMLLCMLFREFRLLTRSLKSAPWLQRTIGWFAEFFVEEDLSGDLEQEVLEAMERIHGLYAAAQSGARQNQQQRRSTMVFPTSPREAAQPTDKASSVPGLLDLSLLLEQRKALLDGLLKGFPSKALKLFVAISPMLSEDDYRRITPVLWESGLRANLDAGVTGSACFLLMQCAEKMSVETLALIEVDLRSSDDRTRLEAVRKTGILIQWRFQISTQNVLTDRTHRPFKMARIPLPFVPTDMGTTLYIPTEDAESGEKSEVPVELKKQLAELGWAEDDQGTIDPQKVWIKTPISLLPITQLDRMDVGAGSNYLDLGLNPAVGSGLQIPTSPRRGARNQRDPEEVGVLRRNSTSGGSVLSQKRRAIFVPPLSTIFICLTRLLHDPNFIIASATRSLLLDLMRNDPSLLTRPIMDIFAGDQKDIEKAITTLSSFFHVHQTLPPPMTHTIFNHLMGFLKYSARQYDMPETLREFGLSLSALAVTITQVNGMSFREIRRSKTDTFVVPSGALWFPTSAPKGPMFPRGTEDFANPFEDVSSKIMALAVVRTSQNMLFFSLLKRNGQEVNMIRKSMNRLVLPSLSPETTEPRAVELKEMIPGKQEHLVHHESTIDTLSLALARSHLLLLAQMFRSMSRHLSDRNELAIMIDGVNRVLCTHGQDIGIVGHALIALMVATTRFRRLFTSRTAYTLFVPALVKVYAESPEHPGIRPAIEYAMSRFYALHKESFLYQALGAIGQMTMFPALDEKAFSESIYTLFFSLTKNAASAVDAAGIHDVNKAQEREALIVDTAEEKPQTFLAVMKRADSQASGQLSVLFPDEYEADRLRMDNFVRLFLTVIAHDLSIVRAQHYLRLLRFLAPQLYNSSSSARAVLLEGISALGGMMMKGPPKSKGVDPLAGKAEGVSSTTENQSFDQSRMPSDFRAMRFDYLHLVLTFGLAGGDVPLKTARQAIEIVKSILKDSSTSPLAGGISSSFNPEADNRALAAFLSDFVKMLLIREQPPVTKAVVIFLQDLAPLLHAYMVTIDFTGIFDTIYQLTLIPIYASDASFSQVVIGEICTAGLAACELAASENQYNLLLALPYRSAFVRLLAECVFLQGGDVLAEIEKRTPTYVFLAGVVFPLVLELKTEAQISADGLRTQERHRTGLAKGWLRLLFYSMGACQKSLLSDSKKEMGGGGLLNVAGSVSGSLHRSKSREKNANEGGGSKLRKRSQRTNLSQLRSQVPVFVLGLQILKVIVVRAELDVSSSILGIWERIASFLKSILAEGDAQFALRGRSLDTGGSKSGRGSEAPSPSVSPTASPRTSLHLDPSSAHARANPGTSPNTNALFVHSPSSPSFRLSSFPNTISTGPAATLRRPRVLDYMLWSTLEFLWAYRSPLRLQLRLLTTEKMVSLDTQLRLKGASQDVRSPLSSIPPSPRTPRSRRVSSIFVKNRGDRGHRSSGVSPAASPDASPLLLPASITSSRGSNPTSLTLDTNFQLQTPSTSPFLDVQQPISISMNQRRPGYQVSPITPIDRPLGVPKIVHLGPASPSAFHNQGYPTSPSGILMSNSSGNRVSTLGFKTGQGSLGGGRKKDGGSGRGGENQATGRDLIRNTKIKSLKLVEGTYRRIRGVQALMGYDLLLPLPRGPPRPGEDDEEDDEVVLKTWTRSQALTAVGQETKDLLEEFEYWMNAELAQEAEQESSDDDEVLEDATDAPALSIQVVDDFGVINTPGGRDQEHTSAVDRGHESRERLLHPHSYISRRPLGQRDWDGDEDGSERTSIVIEVDDTFLAESPAPLSAPPRFR